MNTFLISLGLALVTALTAALIGPSFVDWNSYRTAIEAEGTRLLGSPVVIAGDLDVRLLPSPLVRAGAVNLSAGPGGEPAIEAAAVELSLSLGALILGNVEVAELTLVSPRLLLASLAANLAALPSSRGPRPPNASGATRRIDLRDATVTFTDPFTDAPRTVENVDLSITSTVLSGPFKFNGAYGFDRADGTPRPSFAGSVGTISGGGPVKVSSRIDVPELGEITLDGEIVDPAGAPRYRGKLALEREIVPPAGQPLAQPNPGRLAFDAVIDVARKEAELSELRLTVSEGAHAVVLAGSGRASWNGAPRFSLDLGSRQVDLDGLFSADASGQVGEEVSAIFATLVGLARGSAATGRVQVSVDGAIWRGDLSRDVAALVDFAPEAIRLSNLTASLPGETQATLSGEIRLEPDWGFDGSLFAATVEAGRLIRWIAPVAGAGLATTLSKSRGRFSVRGAVTASPDGIALRSIDGLADGSPFTGAFAIEPGAERPLLRTQLAFDVVDLDRYLPEDMVPADLLAPLLDPDGWSDMEADLALDARAKRIRWLGREAEQVDLAATLRAARLDIERFAVRRYADSSLGLEAQLDQAPAGPLGTIELRVESEDLRKLVADLGFKAPDFPGRDLVATAGAARAELVIALASAASGPARASSLDLSGRIGGADVKVTVASDAALAAFTSGTLNASVRAQAEAADALVGPLGLYHIVPAGTLAGHGAVEITATGRISDGLALELGASGEGASLTGRGRLRPTGGLGAARLDLKIDDLAILGRTLGLAMAPDAGRLADGSAAASDLTALIEGEAEGGGVAIRALRGTIGGEEVSLTGRIAPGEPAAIDVDFIVNRIALDSLLATAFAPQRRDPAAAARADTWSSDLIDTRILDGVDLAATGKIARLGLGPALALDAAEVDLDLSGGILKIARLAGRLGAGTLGASGTLSSADNALFVTGEVHGEAAPLERLLIDEKGRGLVGGTVDFDATMKANGRSLLSIFSSIEGAGTLSARARLPRLDGGRLGDDLAAADAAAFAAALAGARGGATSLGTLETKVEAANGRIRVGPMRIDAGGFGGEATTFIDVPSRRIDQEIVLKRGDLAVSVVHAGIFGAVSRSVERSEAGERPALSWREPPDDYATPGPPSPPPDLFAGQTPIEVIARDLGPAVEVPPVGLIEQQIIDLPILQDVAPPGDGSG